MNRAIPAASIAYSGQCVFRLVRSRDIAALGSTEAPSVTHEPGGPTPPSARERAGDRRGPEPRASRARNRALQIRPGDQRPQERDLARSDTDSRGVTAAAVHRNEGRARAQLPDRQTAQEARVRELDVAIETQEQRGAGALESGERALEPRERYRIPARARAAQERGQRGAILRA